MYAPFGAGRPRRSRGDVRGGRPLPGRRRRRGSRRSRRGGLDRPARTGGGRLAERDRRRRPPRRHRRARPPSAGRRSPSTTTTWPAACAPRWPPSPACGCSDRTFRRGHFRWPPSPSTGVPHALVAARLSAEYGIGVRHGCFCAHPYLLRLLGLSDNDIAIYRRDVLEPRPPDVPGAVRASAGLSTSRADIDALLAAVADIAAGRPAPLQYRQDPQTGDYWPQNGPAGWTEQDRAVGASCARG